MDFLEKICYTRKNNIGINNIFWGRGKNPEGYYYQSFVQLGGEKFVYIPYIAPLLLLLAIIWLI